MMWGNFVFQRQPALHQLLALAGCFFQNASPEVRRRHEAWDASQLVNERFLGFEDFATACTVLDVLKELEALSRRELAIEMALEEQLITDMLLRRRFCLCGFKAIFWIWSLWVRLHH